jgi:hypothetical protein
MYTLIPEQSTKYLKNEYRIRVLILLFLFMSLGVWVGVISLFPSYVVSVTEEKKALAEAGVVEQSAQSASTTSAMAQITEANSAIKTLENSQDSLMLSSIVEDITNRRTAGVVINDFEVGRTGGTGTNIVIEGKAATRDALVAFKNNLASDTRFSKVDLPVSDLAAATGVNFDISVTGIQ